MANDTVLKTANHIHRALLKLSGGRFGWQTGKMPVLQLTTTGRKSGKPRTVMLTTPHQDGEAIVVVASKAGDDRHPEWFLNLRANPEVTVEMKSGPKRPMKARLATDEEHDLLWPTITKKYKTYAGYQAKPTARFRWCCWTPQTEQQKWKRAGIQLVSSWCAILPGFS